MVAAAMVFATTKKTQWAAAAAAAAAAGTAAAGTAAASAAAAAMTLEVPAATAFRRTTTTSGTRGTVRGMKRRGSTASTPAAPTNRAGARLFFTPPPRLHSVPVHKTPGAHGLFTPPPAQPPRLHSVPVHKTPGAHSLFTHTPKLRASTRLFHLCHHQIADRVKASICFLFYLFFFSLLCASVEPPEVERTYVLCVNRLWAPGVLCTSTLCKRGGGGVNRLWAPGV